MPKPRGSLTVSQLEIMRIVWSSEEEGISVAEIWRRLLAQRSVARTTVKTMVKRLEERGWLVRKKNDGVFRYTPTCGREEVTGQLAKEFLNEFFDGSTTKMVRSLLGARRIEPAELDRLRRALDEARNRK